MKINFKIILFAFSFLASFIIFFVVPSYFSSTFEMKQLILLPTNNPIGADWDQLLGIINSWRNNNASQFTDQNILPPLFNLLFLPLAVIPSYYVQYLLLTCVTFICFIFITTLYPYFSLPKDTRDNSVPLIILVFIISLVSYPFLFQIERGQINLIPFSMALAGILIFHKKPKYSWIAYLLLSVSINT
ncbi:MAG: glycosyltransferase 87 family protein, partial [Pseudomonadota bacterium]